MEFVPSPHVNGSTAPICCCDSKTYTEIRDTPEVRKKEAGLSCRIS